MDIPSEALYMMVTVIALSLALGLIGYLTKDSRNFRSRRNRKAIKQF
ncbi:hypothetical protein ACFSQJ_00995 [Croceitalea marina]|uniref:Uncharacterized protein n=1 Tax=Croceitalea marina TaxID=1775166 RepID=A0ABW5MQS8_9FLAO